MAFGAAVARIFTPSELRTVLGPSKVGVDDGVLADEVDGVAVAPHPTARRLRRLTLARHHRRTPIYQADREVLGWIAP